MLYLLKYILQGDPASVSLHPLAVQERREFRPILPSFSGYKPLILADTDRLRRIKKIADTMRYIDFMENFIENIRSGNLKEVMNDLDLAKQIMGVKGETEGLFEGASGQTFFQETRESYNREHGLES